MALNKLPERKNSFLSLPEGVEVTPLGLVIKARLDYKQWSALVERLLGAHRSILWLIGDALVWGMDAFGEEFSHVVSERSKQVQYNAAWVSRSIPISRRREISWSHHFEIAGLEPTEQDKLLQAAVEHHLTVRELRDEVRRLKQGIEAPQDDDGEGFYHDPDGDPNPLDDFDLKEVTTKVLELLEPASELEIREILAAIQRRFFPKSIDNGDHGELR
jgi:hypothetical protein